MRRVVVALVAVACAALAARAQSSLEPPPLDRFVRWGPIRVRPAIALTGLGYDDNVFYRTATTIPPEGDWFATISPSATGLILLGHQAFITFDGRVDYTAFAKNSEINYTNWLVTTRLTVPFRKMGAFVDAAWLQSLDRPLDLQDARPIRREARLGAGLIFKLGWRTEIELGRLDTRFRNTDDNFLQCTGPDGTAPCYTISDLLDRVETGTQVRAWYRAFGRTRLTIEARRKDIDFRTSDPTIARDGDEQRLVPGVDFGEGGRLSGTARAGWSRLDIDGTPEIDYDGLVAEARLAYQVGNGLTLYGSAVRDVAFSIYEGNNFYIRRIRDARGVKYFNRLFGIEAGYGNGHLNFPATGRADRLTAYDLGVRLRIGERTLGRKVEYALRWVRTRTESTDDSRDSSRSTLALGAVLGY